MILPYASPIPGLLLNPGVSQPIHLERRRGQWVGNGVWDEAAKIETITSRGILYPSTDDELQALPEGQRGIKSITLFWNRRFEMDDRVIFHGETYRVVKVGPWRQYGYYKAIAQVVLLV